MTKKTKINEEYFQSARDWYFDRYESVTIQANRWFLGFIASTLLSVCLVIAMISIFPLKTFIPLVIHQNLKTGEIWVDRPKTVYAPENDAQVQADIVRYLTTYVSYTAADINQRFRLILLLSSANVGKKYADEQANSNKSSPVNILGQDGIRTVRVEDIVFIDKIDSQEPKPVKTPSHNLAKVDFETTTIDHAGNKKIENWVATIGWTYKGLPNNQKDAWDNWNGFTVTTLRIDPKNIG